MCGRGKLRVEKSKKMKMEENGGLEPIIDVFDVHKLNRF